MNDNNAIKERYFKQMDESISCIWTNKEIGDEPVMFHGKVMINPGAQLVDVMEDRPRGPRSKKLHATKHAGLFKLPQGGYRVRFEVPDDEIDARALLAEMRKILQEATLDKDSSDN